MKSILVFALSLLATIPAFAGFQGWNQTTDLKIFNSIQCSNGLSCSRTKKGLTISTGGAGALHLRIAAAGAQTLTSTACGASIYNTATSVQTLPLASTVLGCRFTFYVGNASNYDIRANAADQILVATTGVGRAARSATLGNSITIEATAANQWTQQAVVGTWTDTP